MQEREVAYILGVLDALALAHVEPREQLSIFTILRIAPSEVAAVMQAEAQAAKPGRFFIESR